MKTYIIETNIMANDRCGELKIMVNKECRVVLFNCVNLNLITNSKQQYAYQSAREPTKHPNIMCSYCSFDQCRAEGKDSRTQATNRTFFILILCFLPFFSNPIPMECNWFIELTITIEKCEGKNEKKVGMKSIMNKQEETILSSCFHVSCVWK